MLVKYLGKGKGFRIHLDDLEATSLVFTLLLIPKKKITKQAYQLADTMDELWLGHHGEHIIDIEEEDA